MIKGSLRKLLSEYNTELKDAETELQKAGNLDLESEDFIKFAFDQVEAMREKWWKLSWNNKARGEQIIFNGKIYVDNSAKVHTPNLSTIYRLGTNKKDLDEVNFSNMVELPGIAPGSASLSLLVFYRYSLSTLS